MSVKLKAEFFEPLVCVLKFQWCQKNVLIRTEIFATLNSEAMLRWRVTKDEFLFILSLLKLLIIWYLESIETRWSESLKWVSMELHFVKNDLRFSSGKIFVSLENGNYETRIL